jgi:predicted aspartyl protease
MLLTGGARLLLAAAFTSQASAQDLHRPCSDLVMSFDLVSNFEIVVQGQLGELNGLRFILDTGSSYSTIDRKVADRMGLHRRPGTVFNFDRNLAIEWADVPEVRIGPMRVASIGMMVTRLADLSEFAENADGIIGMDVLSRAQKICIDYEERKIFFKLDERRSSEGSATKAFVIPVIIQGISMRLLVDTGFEYVLIYKDRLRSALPHLRTEGDPRDAVIGHLQAVQVRLPGVQLADPQGITPVLLIEGPGNADLDGVDGYLGPAALHAKRLELDFAAKTLRWQ